MLDNKGKLFGKLSVIDLFALLAVAAAAVLILNKLGGGAIIGAPRGETIRMSFSAESVADCVGEYLEEGGLVVDEAKNVALGRILDYEVKPSVEYVTLRDGSVKKVSKPEKCAVYFDTEVEGSLQERGLLVDGNWYIVGHSMSIKAGDTLVYGRVSGIEPAGEGE